MSRIDIDAAASVLGSLARRDEPLAPYCTYRAGGPAALWVDVEHRDDLATVAEAVIVSGCPTLVVGKGSNLLVADNGFAGIALRLGERFAATTIDADTYRVMAGGAAFLPVVARRSAAASLTGFEWAVGVPGSIGGAVRMNAGGHGSDMAASVVEIEIMDLSTGNAATRSADQLEFGYRRSAVAADQLVLAAHLQLRPGDRSRSEAEIGEIVRWRRANQPGGQNAGSVFANPQGDSAGRLIDSLGLKGFRIGSAEVSAKHANFIQVDPGGSADDVFRLIRAIQRRVADATGIELRAENQLIGFPPADLQPEPVPAPDPTPAPDLAPNPATAPTGVTSAPGPEDRR